MAFISQTHVIYSLSQLQLLHIIIGIRETMQKLIKAINVEHRSDVTTRPPHGNIITRTPSQLK